MFNIRQALADGEVTREDVVDLIGHIAISECEQASCVIGEVATAEVLDYVEMRMQ